MAKTNPKEAAVREAAKALATAIREAHGAGYAVTLPTTVDGLDGIAISETAAVHADTQPIALTPAPAGSRVERLAPEAPADAAR
jgi:hypothetical protein